MKVVAAVDTAAVTSDTGITEIVTTAVITGVTQAVTTVTAAVDSTTISADVIIVFTMFNTANVIAADLTICSTLDAVYAIAVD